MQSLDFPDIFRDVMRIRRDVIVRERGGKLEDIASDLWDDSVSLHWVVYITDYVDHELIILGARKKYIGNKVHRQFPVGTIKVRPVIAMVFRPCTHPLGHLRSSKPWRLTTTSHSQKQPENTKNHPPWVGLRTQTNYIQVSDPFVIDWYRGMHWIESILLNAVYHAFYGYLEPEFFHDIFGRVIPLDSDTVEKEKVQGDPAKAAEVRREWKDKIVEVIPDALQWSGVLFFNADMREWTWWYHEIDCDSLEDCTFSDNGKCFKTMTFPDVKERRPSREISLFRLTRAQRKVFNITPTMVGGTDSPSWQVRTSPVAMPIISFFRSIQNL